MNPEPKKGKKPHRHLISGRRADVAEGVQLSRRWCSIVPWANTFKFLNSKQGILSPRKKEKIKANVVCLARPLMSSDGYAFFFFFFFHRT